MLSFYQKLENKLNETDPNASVEAPGAAGAAKSASFKANGARTDAPKPATTMTPIAQAPAVEEPAPEGTEPLDVDLYQSDDRMVIFAQMPGVSKDALDIGIDEESNTVTISIEQKHPPLPPIAGMKDPGDEKGHYVKQETKWKKLYRKVYLPGPFDSGDTEAFLTRGVLVVVLPSKKPGAGKKLTVKEIPDEPQNDQPQK